MDKKQKEALVLAMLEKGESYRSIAQRAKVSPNTIKMLANRAGLDETTSIQSRAFELYVQQKTPVEVAIALNLEAEKAIRYHQEYIMLLGLTEFTKMYIQIKDNPWPYVNLVQLTQNARMGDGEVVELLKIANGYLPRVRLEYDRVKAELNSLEAKKLNLFNEHQRQCDEISNLHTEIDCLQSVLGKLRHEEAALNQQKERTENFVKNLRKDNEICVKFKQMVKQEMENNVLQQPRSLLRIAIASIFESQRKNPEKLLALYYNTSPTLSVERLLSQSSISENQSDPTQFAHNNDSLEILILDEAEQCYNRIVEAYVGKCTNDIPSDADSSSLYEVPYSTQHEMSVDNGYSDHEKSNIEENITQLQGNSADQDNLDIEIKQEEKAVFMNDVFIPPSNMVIDFHPNENETLHNPNYVEPSSQRTLIFDTKDLFPTKAQDRIVPCKIFHFFRMSSCLNIDLFL